MTKNSLITLLREKGYFSAYSGKTRTMYIWPIFPGKEFVLDNLETNGITLKLK